METLREKLLSGGLIFLFGALVTHLWSRFRSRMSTLSWTASTVRLALSGEDPRYGKVEVLYNGVPFDNLHLLTVSLQNQSNTDLRDLVISLAFRDGSRILFSEGGLTGGLHYFVMDDHFLASWTEATRANAPPEQLSVFWVNRLYKVPVLNRQASARFGLLVTRTDLADPTLLVECAHPGVRVRNRPPEELFWGESKNRAAWLGFLIALAATLVLALKTAPPSWAAALIGWFLGGVCVIWGALALKGSRFLARLFG